MAEAKTRQRPRGSRPERTPSEFDQRILAIRRVTRVVRGGRRFSFSLVLVLGNRRGKVGVGVGKGADVSLAMEKALRNAKKTMITLPLDSAGRLPHEVEAKYGASRVMIRPAPGRGVVAGSSARAILVLGGVKDVGAKMLSPSKNKLNNARATMAALQKLEVGSQK